MNEDEIEYLLIRLLEAEKKGDKEKIFKIRELLWYNNIEIQKLKDVYQWRYKDEC